MDRGFDANKSLQELEGNDWGEPKFGSHLATTTHHLRRKPLAQFNAEELRMMIGQRIGLPFLVPLALDRLEDEPLAAGDFYSGDLLAAVLRAGDAYWTEHPDCSQRMRKIVGRVKDSLPSLDESDRASIHDILKKAPPALTE